MIDDDDRYVVVASADRNWLGATIQAEYQTSAEFLAVWGLHDGELIAAGSYDACAAACRLLLQVGT